MKHPVVAIITWWRVIDIKESPLDSSNTGFPWLNLEQKWIVWMIFSFLSVKNNFLGCYYCFCFQILELKYPDYLIVVARKAEADDESGKHDEQGSID